MSQRKNTEVRCPYLIIVGGLSNDTKSAFVSSVLDFIRYEPPKDYSEVLTRFIDDNELWWYKKRPVIAEW